MSHDYLRREFRKKMKKRLKLGGSFQIIFFTNKLQKMWSFQMLCFPKHSKVYIK